MATFNSNLSRSKKYANQVLIYFPPEISKSVKSIILRMIPLVVILSTCQPSVSDQYSLINRMLKLISHHSNSSNIA